MPFYRSLFALLAAVMLNPICLGASSFEVPPHRIAASFVPSSFFGSSRHQRREKSTRSHGWTDIERQLEPAWSAELPLSIDAALDTTNPAFSDERPTLFRERHGWCPYSERVWLMLEVGNVAYDEIRIDNTGGVRPSYFGGQTPQMRWPGQSRPQGESMDLVNKLDQEYCGGVFQSADDRVQSVVSQFRNIFPRARPSSRAAFLFQYNGEPLWKSTFAETLEKTDLLLSQTVGPFFCGNALTVADIAWAPFLERYRYQLPCLHAGLLPDDASIYPHLAAWYQAMDEKVPAYACRVKGDASSWRKVLTMAGFGNAGLPPDVSATMKDRIAVELEQADAIVNSASWKDYASTRPFLASNPAAQAALVITRNRKAIVADLLKRKSANLPSDESDAEAALESLAQLLLGNIHVQDLQSSVRKTVGASASFLDERMCVPRDMGAMSAASIKKLSLELRTDWRSH